MPPPPFDQNHKPYEKNEDELFLLWAVILAFLILASLLNSIANCRPVETRIDHAEYQLRSLELEEVELIEKLERQRVDLESRIGHEKIDMQKKVYLKKLEVERMNRTCYVDQVQAEIAGNPEKEEELISLGGPTTLVLQ